MPRTSKAKPGTPQRELQPASPNGPPAEVLTLAEAAAYLRLREPDVLQLIHGQGLPARLVGSEWRFLKAGIQDWLRTSPSLKSNRDAWMELAGVWKDDPDLEEIGKEINKQREQPLTEAES